MTDLHRDHLMRINSANKQRFEELGCVGHVDVHCNERILERKIQ